MAYVKGKRTTLFSVRQYVLLQTMVDLGDLGIGVGGYSARVIHEEIPDNHAISIPNLWTVFEELIRRGWIHKNGTGDTVRYILDPSFNMDRVLHDKSIDREITTYKAARKRHGRRRKEKFAGINDYAGEMESFRNWCVRHNLNFRATVVQATQAFKGAYDENDV